VLASIRPVNIEYSSLVTKPKLDEIFLNNPSLRNIFTDGFISSFIASLTLNGGIRKNVNILRTNFEYSPLIAGLINSDFLDTNLYRFIKFDVEFVQKLQINKSELVLRVFGGVGYELNSTVNPRKQNTLPFFRQYFAGGPNSMRAWALRKLGPGSVIKDFGTEGAPDRYGDIQLEANIEFRFPAFNISGVKINGALFTDIGNVWLLKKQAGDPEEVFDFDRLGKDLAIGTGVGMRVDLSFFVVRLDYSFKAKNPSPAPADAAGQNKWFYGAQLLKGQLQLGISYPFIQ
jgi:outer membrane protein assembly factor BamA